MKQGYHNSQKEVKGMNTAELREQFLIVDLVKNDKVSFTYSHYDRIIIGGAVPITKGLALENFPILKADFFGKKRNRNH